MAASSTRRMPSAGTSRPSGCAAAEGAVPAVSGRPFRAMYLAAPAVSSKKTHTAFRPMGRASARTRPALRLQMDAGLVPLFLRATVGTAQITAVDPAGELCAVTAPHGVWVHMDAAYAGSALVCPEFTYVIDGVEAVDSFSMNAHKWLLANNDCCAMWVKKPSALVAALGTEQEYILKDAASEGHDVVDYKDWNMTLTRRFRALKMWLVLRCYGIHGLRDHIRSHVRMAEAFEDMVRADQRFEVVTDRTFALVCFRLRPQDKFGGEKTANDLNRGLLDQVNAVTSGPYMSSANVGGMFMLRCAVGSTLTEKHHVGDAWKVVQDRASAILRKMEIIYAFADDELGCKVHLNN